MMPPLLQQMKTFLRHLSSIVLFFGSLWGLWDLTGFLGAADDLLPWLFLGLCGSWGVNVSGIRWLLRRFRVPEKIRGYFTGICLGTGSAFLFFALGFPIAESMALWLRRLRGYDGGDFGIDYFYWECSGMGYAHLFGLYSQTLKEAFEFAAYAFVISCLVSAVTAIPYLLVVKTTKATPADK